MRPPYLLIFLLVIGFTSCKKENAAPGTNYSISGETQISVPSDGYIVYPIAINYVSGEKQEIQLFASGSSSNVICDIDSPIGMPPFNANVIIYGNDAPEGTYTLTITGMRSLMKIKKHSFTLNITTSYTSILIGGKWMQEWEAKDINGNDKTDSLEIHNVAYSGADVFEFYKNGDGKQYIMSDIEHSISMPWSVKNGYLNMYHIDMLNNTDMILKRNDEYGHTVWRAFKRQ